MWKSLQSKDEPPYYINVEVLDVSSCERKLHKVSITNYVKLWSAVFDNNDIIKIMLDSNKRRKIEADGQQFLKVGLSMLNNPKKLHKIEIRESSKTNLDISLTQIRGIVFSMDFTLNLCAAEQFFYDVTRPLLQIIEDQHKSETELRKQMEGIRGYLSKIPKDILMRYEKQDIADYNDAKHMQAHSVMESVFGSDTEEGVDLRHILNSRPPSLKPTLPIKEEPDSTDAGSSTVPSGNPTLSACAIKKEPERQSSQSTNERIPNLGAHGIKATKEETNIESKKNSKIATSSLKSDSPTKTNEDKSLKCESTKTSDGTNLKCESTKTNKGTNLKCEAEMQSQNQRTPPKKRLNELEAETEVSSQSEPSLSHRHGVLTPKKKRMNLNY